MLRRGSSGQSARRQWCEGGAELGCRAAGRVAMPYLTMPVTTHPPTANCRRVASWRPVRLVGVEMLCHRLQPPEAASARSNLTPPTLNSYSPSVSRPTLKTSL